MLLTMIMDSLVQLLAFIFVPFVWWFFTARKTKNFIRWIGLTVPKVVTKSRFVINIALMLLALLVPGIYLILTFEDKSLLATAKFAGTGFAGFIAVLFFAFIQTGLAEEILFRGFINKRLSDKFGFAIGNSVQAALFGLLHGVLLFFVASPFITILVIIFSAFAGWLMGYVNERLADGSIVPGWVVHGIVNVISSLLFLFGIVAP